MLSVVLLVECALPVLQISPPTNINIVSAIAHPPEVPVHTRFGPFFGRMAPKIPLQPHSGVVKGSKRLGLRAVSSSHEHNVKQHFTGSLVNPTLACGGGVASKHVFPIPRDAHRKKKVLAETMRKLAHSDNTNFGLVRRQGAFLHSAGTAPNSKLAFP